MFGDSQEKIKGKINDSRASSVFVAEPKIALRLLLVSASDVCRELTAASMPSELSSATRWNKARSSAHEGLWIVAFRATGRECRADDICLDGQIYWLVKQLRWFRSCPNASLMFNCSYSVHSGSHSVRGLMFRNQALRRNASKIRLYHAVKHAIR